MNELRFFVDGIPESQGSKHAFAVRRKSGGVWTYTGKTCMVDASPKHHNRLKSWRQTVMIAAVNAKNEYGWTTVDEPVGLELVFYLPSPKKPMFPEPAVKPDVGKLARAVEDSLTQAELYADDARIIEEHIRKRYADESHTVGVDIRLWVPGRMI